MAFNEDGDLVAEDVVLGFEVGSYDAVDVVEGGFEWVVGGVGGGEGWVRGEDLAEAGCWEGGFGRYVEGGSGEAVGWWELG